ncbi:hypothetical protein BZA05DRAFT_410293 [Tricharina praecox]|uniref:uncharacterized protein n=1 Tax=Tricharina praecox TaxID=43433 RepID=UPI00221F4543|nr:uncharacterized protein BZA05DRAFT_410293 [Tricharina praecox]KAI5843667.1 hypothetical protein BZA05DRAFT_410293 [Tricharina praecox]
MFEAQALLPGPADKDVEEWPLLELSDVSVVRFRRGHPEELVNLFDVTEFGPFRVKGRLGPTPRKYKKLVRTPDALTQHIIIPKVVTFSMEQIIRKGSDVMETVIWVLGGAAWYRISPAPEYRAHFATLVEKANAWLFMRERYAKFHGRGKPLKDTVMDMFKDYIGVEPECRTARAASKIFETHHRFLLFMMLKPENDAEMWKRSPIFLHFQQEHEETVLEVMIFYGHLKKDRLEPKRNPAFETPAVDDGDEEEDDEEDGDESDDDDDDGMECTPEPLEEQTGKTVSSKGRSILRPSRNEIPIEPPSPESYPVLDDASPIETRLKRRCDSDTIVVAGESRLKRQIMSSPSESPPPTPDISEYRRGGNLEMSKRSMKSTGQGTRNLGARLSMLSEDSYWKCTLDGLRCSHVVPNAKTRDGRHAIEQHYAFHGRVMAEAMQTIDMETQTSSGGGYRVDHLMDKIRMMSQKWEQSKPSPLKGLGE